MTPWAEAMLYAAQRAQLVAEMVAPALARGSFVISDRSLYSSLAYQGAARGLGIGPVQDRERVGRGRRCFPIWWRSCGRRRRPACPARAIPIASAARPIRIPSAMSSMAIGPWQPPSPIE